MISLGLTNYELNELEYAYLTEHTPKNASKFKLFIPALMTAFPRGVPVQRVKMMNNKIFINDKECLPPVHTSVKSQNYLSVLRHPDLEFKRLLVNNDTEVSSTSRFMIHIVNKSVDDMYIVRQM